MNTNFRPYFRLSAALALVLGAAGAHNAAHAADFTLSGQISFHNDVVQLDFSLATPGTDVKIWTDSWQSGLNFDPIAALWVHSGGGYTLVSEVDDDDTVAPGQGFYDTGFSLASLAAGQYRVTLAASFNGAIGTQLTQGFAYDNEAPILLTQWMQPSYDPNANDQKGGIWRVNFANVDAVSAVPEPSSWLLMGLGLGGLILKARSSRKR